MKPLQVKLEHIAEHAALVTLAGWEYRTLEEQAAYLIVEALRARGFLLERPYPPELCQPGCADESARAATFVRRKEGHKEGDD